MNIFIKYQNKRGLTSNLPSIPIAEMSAKYKYFINLLFSLGHTVYCILLTSRKPLFRKMVYINNNTTTSKTLLVYQTFEK